MQSRRLAKKGETYELRSDLNSEYKQKRKETVKKVIANMTIGKDVSSLFADVVKNMQTEDLELKKLVYLYLINYAKTNPELVILAVNTFVKDTTDHNPLIRALAIRTMGCLRVEKIVDYLMDPLKAALVDKDPYVRKTAALCVAKLYDLNPAIAVDNGLVQILQEMLGDGNPMVISNAVAALSEINSMRFESNAVLVKLLAALNECTEWGQICILSSLAGYKPVDDKEALDIAERVIPRLQHANASVVLSAVRVLMVYLDVLPSTVARKLAPPLEAEVQYVALRNINLILQKRPEILAVEMRVFFTKYNDPLYVKQEKLCVVTRLANDANIDSVLSELKEYASEVEIEFVRKAVRAIGRIALKVQAHDKCVAVLADLIKSSPGHVVQEAIIVIKDVFRKYPNKYEAIIPVLCENLESLDEPEARASLVWIIGEYAAQIENAAQLLDYLSESFSDQAVIVQLALLTATIKLFLLRPDSSQALVNRLLESATQLSHPDVRDRAYIYWRLLSSSPENARRVLLAPRPSIVYSDNAVSEGLLDELIANIGSLASVYHVSPALVGAGRVDKLEVEKEAAEVVENGGIGDLLDLGFTAVVASAPGGAGIDDLLGLVDMGDSSPPGLQASPGMQPMGGLQGLGGLQGVNSSPVNPMDDLLGGFDSMGMGGNTSPQTTVLAAKDAGGFQVQTFFSSSPTLRVNFIFTNTTDTPMTDIATQFNVNSYGLTPSSPLDLSVPPHSSVNASQELVQGGGVQRMDPVNLLQVAVKNNVGVYYFSVEIPLEFVKNFAI